MSPTGILQELVAFVKRKMPGSDVSGATDLKKDVPFDSLDRMELFAMIERRYGVSVPPERYIDDSLQILERLAAYVEEEQVVRKP